MSRGRDTEEDSPEESLGSTHPSRRNEGTVRIFGRFPASPGSTLRSADRQGIGKRGPDQSRPPDGRCAIHDEPDPDRHSAKLRGARRHGGLGRARHRATRSQPSSCRAASSCRGRSAVRRRTESGSRAWSNGGQPWPSSLRFRAPTSSRIAARTCGSSAARPRASSRCRRAPRSRGRGSPAARSRCGGCTSRCSRASRTRPSSACPS